MFDEEDDELRDLRNRLTDVLTDLPQRQAFFADQLLYEVEGSDRELAYRAMKDMERTGVLVPTNSTNSTNFSDRDPAFGRREFQVDAEALNRYKAWLEPAPAYEASSNDTLLLASPGAQAQGQGQREGHGQDQDQDQGPALSQNFAKVLSEVSQRRPFFPDQLLYELEGSDGIDRQQAHKVMEQMARAGVLVPANPADRDRPFAERQFYVNHQALQRHTGAGDQYSVASAAALRSPGATRVRPPQPLSPNKPPTLNSRPLTSPGQGTGQARR